MKTADRRGKGFLWFLILLGAICGSLLGEFIGSSVKSLSFLKTSYIIGTSSPFVLNLKVMILTLGLNFNINIMTIIGIILAIMIYRK